MKSRRTFALTALWVGCSVAGHSGSFAATPAGAPTPPVAPSHVAGSAAAIPVGVAHSPTYVVYAIPQINTNQNVAYGLNSYHHIAGETILPPVKPGTPTTTYGLFGGANLGGQM